MDNCVGQYKSHVQNESHHQFQLILSYDVLTILLFSAAAFMFMSLLSMRFYKRVICQYLISGHSHMMPDRLVCNRRKSFGSNNFYLPTEMIERISSTNTVKGRIY